MNVEDSDKAEGTDLIAEWQALDRQFRHFQLLFVAVKADIPTTLEDGPRTLEQISGELGLVASRLYRVLRGLIWCRAIATNSEGAFLLTSAGRSLLDDHPQSIASSLRFQGEFFFQSWGHLWDYLSDGATPFQRAHEGKTLFDLLESDEKRMTLFSAPMTTRSALQSSRIVEHPSLTALRNAVPSPVIVDVGGGEGRLLADLLKAYPEAWGLLLELPVLQAAAARLIAAEGLSERCGFVAGDMMTAVPDGGDVYVLKWVLHDWDDQGATRILRCCADAMRRRGENRSPFLLIIERLMPETVGEANTGLVQADLNMLCQMGGAERTPAEFETLIAQAGLRLSSAWPLEDALGFVALECRLA